MMDGKEDKIREPKKITVSLSLSLSLTRRGHGDGFGRLLLGRCLYLVDDGLGVNTAPVKLALIGQDVLHVVFAQRVGARRRGPNAHHCRHILPLLVLGYLCVWRVYVWHEYR